MAPGAENLDFLVVLFADCLCSVQIVIDIPRLNVEPVRNLADEGVKFSVSMGKILL